MKRLIATAFVLSVASIGLMGCNSESKTSIKKETTIDTPGGTTTITTEKEVKQSTDKPINKTP